jgi:hypothetical protein
MEGGGVPPYFGFLEEAQVCTDNQCSAPITNATVTVNGGALSYESAYGAYFGTFLIPEGDPVTLQVAIGATVYSATGTQFTTAPTITAPVPTPDGGPPIWQASSANNITWTGGGPTAGAVYFAEISPLSANNFWFPADGGSGEVPIATPSVTVPAGTLPPGVIDLYLLVGIVTPGAYFQDSGGIAIADAGTGSGLWLGLLAQPVAIYTQ